MPNDSRDKILRRIREALTTAAPARHRAQSTEPTHPATDWLPSVPPDPAARLAQFEQNCAALKTELILCTDEGALATALAGLAKENAWESLATHDFEMGRQPVAALNLPTLRTDQPYEVPDLERCDVGISGCDALISQTGGILVTATSAGGRALSVLPPHHVVIASADQLVGDLSDAFAVLREKYGTIPAFASFITGPSRTGDIERILVLGAHGPKKLTVLLLWKE